MDRINTCLRVLKRHLAMVLTVTLVTSTVAIGGIVIPAAADQVVTTEDTAQPESGGLGGGDESASSGPDSEGPEVGGGTETGTEGPSYPENGGSGNEGGYPGPDLGTEPTEPTEPGEEVGAGGGGENGDPGSETDEDDKELEEDKEELEEELPVEEYPPLEEELEALPLPEVLLDMSPPEGFGIRYEHGAEGLSRMLEFQNDASFEFAVSVMGVLGHEASDENLYGQYVSREVLSFVGNPGTVVSSDDVLDGVDGGGGLGRAGRAMPMSSSLTPNVITIEANGATFTGFTVPENFTLSFIEPTAGAAGRAGPITSNTTMNGHIVLSRNTSLEVFATLTFNGNYTIQPFQANNIVGGFDGLVGGPNGNTIGIIGNGTIQLGNHIQVRGAQLILNGPTLRPRPNHPNNFRLVSVHGGGANSPGELWFVNGIMENGGGFDFAAGSGFGGTTNMGGGAVLVYQVNARIRTGGVSGVAPIFRNNVARNGGALYVRYTHANIDNTTFADNRTESTLPFAHDRGKGGAIYHFDLRSGAGAGLPALNRPLIINNSQFLRNRAFYNAGAILSRSQISVRGNTLFYRNEGESGGAITLRLGAQGSANVFFPNRVGPSGGMRFAHPFSLDSPLFTIEPTVRFRDNLARGGTILLPDWQDRLFTPPFEYPVFNPDPAFAPEVRIRWAELTQRPGEPYIDNLFNNHDMRTPGMALLLLEGDGVARVTLTGDATHEVSYVTDVRQVNTDYVIFPSSTEQHRRSTYEMVRSRDGWRFRGWYLGEYARTGGTGTLLTDPNALQNLQMNQFLVVTAVFERIPTEIQLHIPAGYGEVAVYQGNQRLTAVNAVAGQARPGPTETTVTIFPGDEVRFVATPVSGQRVVANVNSSFVQDINNGVFVGTRHPFVGFGNLQANNTARVVRASVEFERIPTEIQLHIPAGYGEVAVYQGNQRLTAVNVGAGQNRPGPTATTVTIFAGDEVRFVASSGQGHRVVAADSFVQEINNGVFVGPRWELGGQFFFGADNTARVIRVTAEFERIPTEIQLHIPIEYGELAVYHTNGTRLGGVSVVPGGVRPGPTDTTVTILYGDVVNIVQRPYQGRRLAEADSFAQGVDANGQFTGTRHPLTTIITSGIQAGAAGTTIRLSAEFERIPTEMQLHIPSGYGELAAYRDGVRLGAVSVVPGGARPGPNDTSITILYDDTVEFRITPDPGKRVVGNHMIWQLLVNGVPYQGEAPWELPLGTTMGADESHFGVRISVEFEVIPGMHIPSALDLDFGIHNISRLAQNPVIALGEGANGTNPNDVSFGVRALHNGWNIQVSAVPQDPSATALASSMVAFGQGQPTTSIFNNPITVLSGNANRTAEQTFSWSQLQRQIGVATDLPAPHVGLGVGGRHAAQLNWVFIPNAPIN